MSRHPTEPLRIEAIPPAQRPAALELIVGQLPEADRQRQIATLVSEDGVAKTSLDGLFGGFRGKWLVGAALAQVLPGRAASVWPPRIVAGEPSATARQLLDRIADFLAAQGVRIAQTLLDPATRTDEQVLGAGGFCRLSDLLYLVCLNSEFPTAPPPTSLEFEVYDPANHRRMAAMVEATYQRTLDCPQLNGLRQIEDVLAGYRGCGVFDASRWLLVRHGGKDVGCLLLSDYPDYDNWELVYMGVAPWARGNGWGIEIVRYAQWRARQAGRMRLVLAVDAANRPAIAMYAAAGFQTWDQRVVWLKVFA